MAGFWASISHFNFYYCLFIWQIPFHYLSQNLIG